MENNENKKSFEALADEALADEALDAVAGGADTPAFDTVAEFGAQFPRNNCDRCMYAATPQCCYYPMGPVGAMLAGLAPSATCPGLAVK